MRNSSGGSFQMRQHASGNLLEDCIRNAPSVPFTRGTPPWRIGWLAVLMFIKSFSPLHEGDTSVAAAVALPGAVAHCFSPLHEGDTSVANTEVTLVSLLTTFGPLCSSDLAHLR